MKEIVATLLAIALLVICCQPVSAESKNPKFELEPTMMANVNSRTIGNAIPWCQSNVDEEYVLIAHMSHQEKMFSVIQGKYEYSIYRFTYEISEEIKGKVGHATITFYIERRFPTPESGIKLKELWLTHAQGALRFSIDKGQGHLIVRNICRKEAA